MKQPVRRLHTGSSLLITVFIIAALLGVVLLSLISLLLLETKRSVGIAKSHQLFYAIEGAFHDTVLRLKTDWKDETAVEDTFQIGKSTVKRSVVTDPVTNALSITIKADQSGIRRQVASTFFRDSGSATEETERAPLDIMLVLDRSGSMSDAITDLKEAAIRFIDSPLLNESDRVGLVSYSDSATFDSNLLPLTSGNRTQLKNLIINLYAEGATNIDHAIQLADQELRAKAQEGGSPVMIVFSDGIPNRTVASNICSSYPCIELYDTGKFPVNLSTGLKGGNVCSNPTILRAQAARNTPVPVFGQSIKVISIFLQNMPSNASIECGNENRDRAEKLGEYTLREIADPNNFYLNVSSEQLLETFTTIAESISKGSVQYQEVEPEEEF